MPSLHSVGARKRCFWIMSIIHRVCTDLPFTYRLSTTPNRRYTSSHQKKFRAKKVKFMWWRAGHTNRWRQRKKNIILILSSVVGDNGTHHPLTVVQCTFHFLLFTTECRCCCDTNRTNTHNRRNRKINLNSVSCLFIDAEDWKRNHPLENLFDSNLIKILNMKIFAVGFRPIHALIRRPICHSHNEKSDLKKIKKNERNKRADDIVLKREKSRRFAIWTTISLCAI